jgi:LPS-assembly lipoprotein
MWWFDRIDTSEQRDRDRVARDRVARLAARLGALGLAACLGGCFQPLYGDHSIEGGPGLRSALSAVDVKPIDAARGTDEARVAVEIRNALIFDLTGGGAAPRPAYSLVVHMSSNLADIIVDTTTTRPAIEDYGITATYTLTEIASSKQVVSGQTFARVSYDIPGQEQRFARLRGLRDAETRAGQVIADNIRSRLASYFAAGT